LHVTKILDCRNHGIEHTYDDTATPVRSQQRVASDQNCVFCLSKQITNYNGRFSIGDSADFWSSCDEVHDVFQWGSFSTPGFPRINRFMVLALDAATGRARCTAAVAHRVTPSRQKRLLPVRETSVICRPKVSPLELVTDLPNKKGIAENETFFRTMVGTGTAAGRTLSCAGSTVTTTPRL